MSNNLARDFVALFVVSAGMIGSCIAEPAFVPVDVEVCGASANVRDPEFDSKNRRMLFSDDKQRLKVAGIKLDGSIQSPSCRCEVIDTNLTLSMPGISFFNGGEWAKSQSGLEIFYTKLDTSQRPVLARAWLDGSWRTETLENGTDRAFPGPSSDPLDPNSRLFYWRLLSDGSYEMLWRESTQPSVEHTMPGFIGNNSGGVPRWIPGQRSLTTVLPDAQGTMQAAKYNIDEGSTVFLTADAGNKDEVWMWSAPEFQNQAVFFTVVDGCCIRIYREIGGVWTVVKTVNSADLSSFRNLYSPQPFVYKNKSYIAMQLASGGRYTTSEIWIVAVDPDDNLARQVSDPTLPPGVRNEPEWFVTPLGLFVYYTQVSRGGFSLRRANSGL